MKKGLIITLVIAVALIWTSGFSFAPVLKTVPDVIVGDSETADGGPTFNLFRFSDAFAFDTYVTDNDSTISQLKWSYAKTGGAYNYTINDKGPSSDVTFLNPSTASNIRSGFTTASFRNETLSPSSANGPYAEPSYTGIDAGQNVYLALYVSDGTFKDSQEITVYTINNGFDGLSNVGIAPVKSEEWASSANGWNTFVGGAINTTYGDWNAGQIRIKFPTASGWPNWTQTLHGTTSIVNDITGIDNNSVYILRLKMSTDQATNPPAVRVRVGHDNFSWAAQGNFGKLGGVGGYPTTTPQDFYIVWKPQGSAAGANAFIAFDTWAAGITGNVFVDNWKLYRIPDASVTTAATEADITNFSTWASSVSGGVTISAANITFGAIPSGQGWQNAAKFVTLTNPIAANNVYRLSYYLAKVGTAKSEQIRLRANDAINGASDCEFVFDDSWAATGNLTTTAAPYRLYRWAANGRDATNGDFAVWCDRIGGGTLANTVLSRVLIEKITFPALLD